jgi:hypothetical protein
VSAGARVETADFFEADPPIVNARIGFQPNP